MGVISKLRKAGGKATMPLTAGLAHARRLAGRPARFHGTWPTVEAALASLPTEARGGYDTEGVADISFEQMARVVPWDYPVLFWLRTLLPDGGSVLDAGGHMGTKYLAFRSLMPLEAITWTVCDLPAIVRAARSAQAAGKLPVEIGFSDQPSQTSPADVLLASGLLQYLDTPLSAYVDALPARPDFLLLNKVALRDGPQVVTLEQIGPARVPYQIRSRQEFLREVGTMGYVVRDTWRIPELNHVIPSHPWLGSSASEGFLLAKADDSQ